MARFYTPTSEQEEGWKEWVSERPAAVRAVAERFDPWSLYRLKSSGHRVSVYSFSEGPPVTLTVAVLADFNAVMFERQVFGILPDDLEPCELPAENEVVGALMSQEEVEENLDALRVTVRPDLWQMSEDGTAMRKN
jgi:hypothetical protein